MFWGRILWWLRWGVTACGRSWWGRWRCLTTLDLRRCGEYSWWDRQRWQRKRCCKHWIPMKKHSVVQPIKKLIEAWLWSIIEGGGTPIYWNGFGIDTEDDEVRDCSIIKKYERYRFFYIKNTQVSVVNWIPQEKTKIQTMQKRPKVYVGDGLTPSYTLSVP